MYSDPGPYISKPKKRNDLLSLKTDVSVLTSPTVGKSIKLEELFILSSSKLLKK